MSWEEGFCDGLVKSKCFVPLFSRGSSKNFMRLAVSSPCDNVLLEYNLALELRERGLIEFIFPVLIGDAVVDSTKPSGVSYEQYFASGCHPDLSANGLVCVDSIITKLSDHLKRMSLGSMLLEKLSIGEIVSKITINQGYQIAGEKEAAFEELVSKVRGLIKVNHNKSQATTFKNVVQLVMEKIKT